MFKEKFDTYACIGDTISTSSKGFTITARIEFDDNYKIDDDDCHNLDQKVTGCDDEQFTRLLANRKAWFDDEWFYCGIVLSVSKNEIELVKYAASLWGIECNYPDGNNDHLTEAANDLLDAAVDEADSIMAALVA